MVADHVNIYSCTAPSAPPESVEVTVTGSKTATFSWEPPTLKDQNGPLILYILVLSELQFNLSYIEANTTILCFHGLARV